MPLIWNITVTVILNKREIFLKQNIYQKIDQTVYIMSDLVTSNVSDNQTFALTNGFDMTNAEQLHVFISSCLGTSNLHSIHLTRDIC